MAEALAVATLVTEPRPGKVWPGANETIPLRAIDRPVSSASPGIPKSRFRVAPAVC